MFSLSQKFLFSSLLRKQESSFFWIPGRVSLARNDDPTPENVKRSESPGRARGLPNGNYMNVIATISGFVSMRIGGPHVPAPLEV